jgi:hypothetical protein
VVNNEINQQAVPSGKKLTDKVKVTTAASPRVRSPWLAASVTKPAPSEVDSLKQEIPSSEIAEKW